MSLVKIRNALFVAETRNLRAHKYVFSKPIANFDVDRPSAGTGKAFYAITGPQKSAFLNVVAAKYIPDPPLGRVYPQFSDTHRSDQIQYLNFMENSGLDKVHMAARYESYSYKGTLEMKDDVNSVINYVTGANNYNSNTVVAENDTYVQKLCELFGLDELRNKWINRLSNGQMRRARISKALINKPQLIVIDDPFLGLDPRATEKVSESLRRIALELDAGMVLGLRIQDKVPDWVDNLAYVDESGLTACGPKSTARLVIEERHKEELKLHKTREALSEEIAFVEVAPQAINSTTTVDDPIIEFSNAYVSYRGTDVLKNFTWRIQRGSRWRILGENGSGKTTILSLITADHPQSWRSVVSIDGTLRKTGQGVSYFDVNNRIGISSPELHATVPPRAYAHDVVYNGLVRDIGNSNFKFKYKYSGDQNELPEEAQNLLQVFAPELAKIRHLRFHELTVSQQKLVLFLRAAIKNPDILILDEAFSCMDDEVLMNKCHDYIAQEMPKTTVLAIGHIDWEVPVHEHVITLHGDPQRGYSFATRAKAKVNKGEQR
ncbi:hypothetical protein FDK38_004249 [Candidozyma auris]|nr:hypothetical protein FDK38_004249 [[Candida] auris]